MSSNRQVLVIWLFGEVINQDWHQLTILITLLTLKALITTAADNILIFFFFLIFRGNKTWHFM